MSWPGPVHGVLEGLREFCQHPVAFISPEFQVIDHAGRVAYRAEFDLLSSRLGPALRDHPSPDGTWSIQSGSWQGLAAPVEGPGTRYGYLVLILPAHSRADAGPGAEKRAALAVALRYAAHMAARKLERFDGAFQEQEEKLRLSFLTDLLHGRFRTKRAIIASASPLGIDLSPPQLVLIVSIDAPKGELYRVQPAVPGYGQFLRDRIGVLLKEISRPLKPPAQVVDLPEGAVLLCPLAPDTPRPEAKQWGLQLARRIQEGVRQSIEGVSVSIGVGEPGAVTDIATSFQQACQALRLGRLRQRSGSIRHFSDLGLMYLLDGYSPEERLRAYVERVLDPLLRPDRQQWSGLLKTLETYLECDCDRHACAKALFLHPNTVSYRIRQAESILGLQLRNGEDRFNLQLALEIRRYLNGVEPGPSGP